MRKEAILICILLMAGAYALAPEDLTLSSPSLSFYSTNTIELNIFVSENVSLTMTLDGNTTELCQNCISYSNTTLVSEGQHLLIITASDNSGKNVAKNRTFFVDLPPTTSLTTPSFITNQTNQTLSCNASDTQGLSSLKTIVWYANGSEQSSQEMNISGFNNQISLTSMFPDGNYTWNCIANDTSGNLDWDENRTFLIDSVAPTSPPFSCTPPSITKGETLTCACSGANDALSGIASYSYPTNPSTQTNGTFTINCTVSDRAGNSNTVSTSYTVNQPPENTSSQNTPTNQPTNTQPNTPSTKKNTTINNTNTTTTTNAANGTSAAEVAVSVENSTTTGELQQSSEASTAPITGAAIGLSQIKSMLPIATFIGMILFIASFVVFVRKKIIPKKSKPKASTTKANKFRKPTILE